MPGKAVAVTRPASDEMLVAESAGRADEEAPVGADADRDPGFPGFWARRMRAWSMVSGFRVLVSMGALLGEWPAVATPGQ